ncbi:MAG: VOC family protein [Thermoleophilaceae bacterium]|nr:VOC family protein [Thermoleophilaceae bacterium]
MRVRDLDAAVEFQTEILGLVETERVGGVSYLTCNERHHELMLIEDREQVGYDHIGLEVDDAATLETARPRIKAAGGRVIGDIFDGEPGIDRALLVQGPSGHVFKLFCGMETVPAPGPGDRPIKFEHVSLKALKTKPVERFLQDGLGFRFSDRMGPFASWWHCDADHHGMAVVLAPKAELSHYAWTVEDLNQMGRIADKLKQGRDQKLIWGPSRHGPGNNQFSYFLDHDGAMIELCADLAQMPPDGDYVAREWPNSPTTINQWGAPPPLKFIRAGFPIVQPRPVAAHTTAMAGSR